VPYSKNYPPEDALTLPPSLVIQGIRRSQGEATIRSRVRGVLQEIQDWVQGRVSKHKFLRGGVVIIDQVPKSGAGKILRKELRNLAKAESGPKPKL
jgi:acyl-coenzyme A synthetase/AMP-(fatty) acid ligase